MGVQEVIQDIDAAAKSQTLIHHTQLAMHTSPTAWQPKPWAHRWGKHMHLHASLSHPRGPGHWQLSRAHTVDHHAYVHTALSCAHQRKRHIGPRAFKTKYVGF